MYIPFPSSLEVIVGSKGSGELGNVPGITCGLNVLELPGFMSGDKHDGGMLFSVLLVKGPDEDDAFPLDNSSSDSGTEKSGSGYLDSYCI